MELGVLKRLSKQLKELLHMSPPGHGRSDVGKGLGFGSEALGRF